MVLSINFLNPITNVEDVIKFDTSRINYNDYYYIIGRLKNGECDLIKYLFGQHDSRLKGLTHETDYTSFSYEKTFVNPVLYCLLRINDVFIYNSLLDTFIEIHKENIIAYYANKEMADKTAKIAKTKKSKRPKNKFYRQEQYDIFGNLKYIYVNPKTEETIESNNPDLLETLNKPKKKARNVVSLENMTFSFKKK